MRVASFASRPRGGRMPSRAAMTSSSTSSLITPAITASRTTGTAPLAVFFDASGTTAASLTSLPFHELLYSWDFGDGTGTFWSYGAKAGTADRNYAYGPEAAHVFESAGSKTVTLTVIHISSGGTITTASTTQGITVSAANSDYPTTATYVISTSGTFTGEPSGATRITTSSVTTALAGATTANRRFLFRGGETFSIDNLIEIQKQNIQIGSFGTGKANFTHSAAANGIRLWDGANDASGFTWMDASFDGGSTGSTGNWKGLLYTQAAIGGTLKNALMLRCDAYRNGSLGSVSAVDGMFWVECYGHDLTGGLGNVGMYAQYGSRTAVLGSSVVDCYGIEHNIRFQGVDRVVISNNLIRGAGASGKQNIAIRGYSQQETAGRIDLWSGIWTEKIVIGDNEIDGGTNGTGLSVQIAPQNTGAYERIRDVIFERNYSHGSIYTPFGSEAESNVTVRNNLILSEQPSDGNGSIWIYAGNTVGVAAPTAHYIYNNSVYKPSTPTSMFSFIEMQGGGTSGLPSGIIVRNNLVYAPAATQDIFTGTSSYQFALRSGITSSAYTESNNSSNAQITGTSSGWTMPPTTLAQWKPTSGYGINGGTYVPVYEDFFNVQRTGTMDMGAVNP